MKQCVNCAAAVSDDSVFCPICGASCANAVPTAPEQPQQPPQNQPPKPQAQPQAYPYGAVPPVAPVQQANSFDHTAEFDPADIHENKVMALLAYLNIFVLIPILAAKDSPFTQFHIRQALKLLVAEVVTVFLTAVLSWTFIVPAAGVVCAVILIVVQAIGFVRAAQGRAEELPIIRSLGFLN